LPIQWPLSIPFFAGPNAPTTEPIIPQKRRSAEGNGDHIVADTATATMTAQRIPETSRPTRLFFSRRSLQI
jgi:hypothetical protein